MSETLGWLLALDTATNTVVVVAGGPDGRPLGQETFEGRYRHSQELLPAVARLVDRLELRLGDLAGIVVGTGPGTFTGLRVGLATAKTLAHELAVPVVGVSTAEALLDAVDDAALLLLPAGARERVLVLPGQAPRIVRSDWEWTALPGSTALAVDLEGRAQPDELACGRQAVERLGATILRLGAARLTRGEADDPERLVPQYASPPRGAPGESTEGGMAWSRDPR